MEETALPTYFGGWLKCRRTELDLTQAELARRVGCSVPALRKIESGERRPSKQLAGLLARSLEIPPEDQLNFIRVARGELNVERLHSSTPRCSTEHAIRQKPPIFRSNLPVQLTPLIGREAELDTLATLLAEPQCHLLTITGMGGIGKTRLAIELAATHQGLVPGGAFYVSLAPLNSPEFIVPAIAEALGLTFSGALDPKDQLINHLVVSAKQALLVVLDNLEHLLQPSNPEGVSVEVPMLITEMLERIPNIKILVTSRERICLQGEWIFELHGLPVPEGNHSNALESYSAITLFIQRARQVKVDFEVLPDDWISLVRVCRLVEGSPLAIELAAAWAGVLSINEIAREITSNLDFLSTTTRDIPERHRSLRATFDHSWKLLSIEEQQSLIRLAVFRGGFQREAAERVAGSSLQILMSLYSKSLLIRRENGRYDLHEIVRQYALSHFTDDPQVDETRERHCKYYLGLVRGEAKGFSEADQWIGYQTLMDELDNFRAAMSWGLWNYQVRYTLQIATALGQFWFTRGYWREGLEWLDWGLTGPGSIPGAVRAKALTVAGRLTRYLGDYPRAISMLQEGLTLWGQCDDQTGMAQTLCNLGAAVYHQGDNERATVMLEEALDLAKQQGDRRGRYCSLENLGHLASDHGDNLRAIELYSESLSLAREASDDDQVARMLNAIGGAYMTLGNYDRAEDYFSPGATICQSLGNRLVAAYISGNRGYIAMKQGNLTRAFVSLVEAILILRELGAKEDAILCIDAIAFIATEQHFPDRAARLLGANASLRRVMGVIREPSIQADYDKYTADISHQLGKAVFEAAWAEGCKMTFEQAVDYAVDGSFF